MNKITQFSTIGALMSGFFKGEFCLLLGKSQYSFGLGCSEKLNGELTVFDGIAYRATADESLTELEKNSPLPFVQVTDFTPQHQHNTGEVNEQNIESILRQSINPDNIFLAITIEAHFDTMIIRRPHRQDEGERSVEEVASAQQVDTHHAIGGHLVGFWTPELFGRVSVPGFHFHFLDTEKHISGHVLQFSAKSAVLSFEEKRSIEITLPDSEEYTSLPIDVAKLDQLIHKIEK
ncbi:MAG: Alpha-acetolactate decarboxylase [Candidatus Erwinia impunctatus]|nr:Alpha-acetolactate decarboxylase [Culicoides impunctatus]